MKQIIFNKVRHMAKAFLPFYLFTLLPLFTACSDVEYEAANYSEAVNNLVAEYTEGSRQVTLRWDNPSMSGQSGIQIIKDKT